MANEAPENAAGPQISGEPASVAEPAPAAEADVLRGAVLVGVVPGLPTRVLKEAARYAMLLRAPLVVVHVDVTRFVTYEDPDGYVHSAPIDINVAAGESDLAVVEAEAAKVLEGHEVDWTVKQLVGDPAMAMKHLADQLDARLLVVGTRKRGLGESIREFFTGSVAARLAHRQRRPLLVIPLGEPVPDDEEIWPS
jgi:nucleotide-binding universal stress UspA family protein